MAPQTPQSDPSQLRAKVLSRWDNEGGALRGGSQEAHAASREQRDAPDLSNAELVQLQVRVIALENLLIALLAEASDRQLDLIREMAGFILPRPDSTEHPLTTQAATQMIHLVDRAVHFQSSPPA